MNEKYRSTLVKYKNILNNELGYSESTIKTYSSHLKEYFEYFDKPALHLTKSDYKEFIQNNKFEYSKHNQFISSVKLFYEHILKVKIKEDDFIRPRKIRKLPDILTKEEIENIIDSIDNLKQKTIFATLYYFGLRRSEIFVHMIDFDKKRRLLHIKQSKFNKDRFIPFQNKWVDIANKYVKKYGIKSDDYLFGYYSYESMYKILKRALLKCRINKNVSLHSLRRSYACHLYESGISLLVIQKILGHNCYKSTLLYVQVSEKHYENAFNIL